jgi:hypothetical protein
MNEEYDILVGLGYPENMAREFVNRGEARQYIDLAMQREISGSGGGQPSPAAPRPDNRPPPGGGFLPSPPQSFLSPEMRKRVLEYFVGQGRFDPQTGNLNQTKELEILRRLEEGQPGQR